jgi:hypothetical protein
MPASFPTMELNIARLEKMDTFTTIELEGWKDLTADELVSMTPIVIGSVELTDFTPKQVYYLWEFTHVSGKRVYCWNEQDCTIKPFIHGEYIETEEEAMRHTIESGIVWTKRNKAEPTESEPQK